MVQKWRVLRSDTLLKDRWIDLRADHCVTPDGTELNPYYVLRYPEWVHVLALTVDGRAVLVRQYRHAAGEALLELPGGMADPGDASPEHAARRELEEETGYTAPRWERITSLYPNPATHTNRIHGFLALDAVCDWPQRLDAGEGGMLVETIDVSALLAGLRDGLVGQATHVSLILLGLAMAGRVSLAATQPGGGAR